MVGILSHSGQDARIGCHPQMTIVLQSTGNTDGITSLIAVLIPSRCANPEAALDRICNLFVDMFLFICVTSLAVRLFLANCLKTA